MEKPMIILLLGVLLTHLGTYLVIPILPILLSESIGLNVTTVGISLATYAISFQFGSLTGGFLADRLGRRMIITVGALVAAIGFVGIGFSTSFLFIVVSIAITGYGNGLNAPSTKAGIAAMASEDNQTTAFSFRGIVANVGMGASGLIIFFFIIGTPPFLFFIASGIYVVLAIISWLALPAKCGDAPCPPIPTGAYKRVFRYKPFVVFGIVSIFIWALYGQLALALPIQATNILEEPNNVALVWTVKSVTVIVFQSWITKHFISRIHPFVALAIGLLLLGVGLGSLYWAQSFIGLVWSGTIFVVGEMLLLPTMDSTISQLSKEGLIGLFFALANVLSGLGESIGNLLGGRVLELGSEATYLPWLVYSLIALCLSLVVLSLIKWKPLQAALQKAAKQQDRPKKAPRVNPGPGDHLTHPFHKWEEDVLFRRRQET
ncbi:MFS transporter [Radiobacillus deserti]|uniref:MFS transporter n=2 Tax=Radiobacillus deserti TaxID=2594883 RepID=A0A516KLC1_9BACI|nr:MFS transporter [Radiobacillus deserti]